MQNPNIPDNPIANKTKAFALRIIQLYKFLTEKKREFIISKQIIRSGTSIGANVKEAIRGQSKADFHAKMNIALKEASETEYWLELLVESDYITQAQFDNIYKDIEEILRILVTIVKKTESKN